jgi:hypothetical protein
MKIKIKDISFVQYYSLKDKSVYNYFLNYAELKPIDLFKLGDIFDLPFGFVKDMQDYLNFTGLTWEDYISEISKFKHINKRQIVKYSLFELQASRLWLREQIIKINELESEIGHEPTSEEQAAGLEIFAKYRAFLQFDNLAGGDITKIEAIRALPYSTCFAKMKLDADRKEYELKLNEILKRKK